MIVRMYPCTNVCVCVCWIGGVTSHITAGFLIPDCHSNPDWDFPLPLSDLLSVKQSLLLSSNVIHFLLRLSSDWTVWTAQRGGGAWWTDAEIKKDLASEAGWMKRRCCEVVMDKLNALNRYIKLKLFVQLHFYLLWSQINMKTTHWLCKDNFKVFWNLFHNKRCNHFKHLLPQISNRQQLNALKHVDV